MAKVGSGAVSKTAKNSATKTAKNSADTAKTAKNLAQNLAKNLARNSRIPIGACLADIKPKIDYPLILGVYDFCAT